VNVVRDRIGKYSGLAMVLHWLVAVAVIVNWQIATAGESAPTREARGEIMGNHFALGVVIFALVAIRFAWRATHPAPAPNPGHATWEQRLARLSHGFMYALLLIMPLAGWFAMSKYESGIDIWGFVEVPPLPVAPDPDLAGTIFELHAAAGIALLVTIAIHILAVLKHSVLDRDGTVFRMLPFGSTKG